MTRKRFVKLLMATGKQRNEAQAIAMAYNAERIPYKNAFKFLSRWIEIEKRIKRDIISVKEALKRIGFAAQKAGEEISKLSTALKEVGALENGN